MCILMRNFFQKNAKLFFGDNSDPVKGQFIRI